MAPPTVGLALPVNVNQENAPQTYLQASLIQTDPQLKFHFPDYSSLYQVDKKLHSLLLFVFFVFKLILLFFSRPLKLEGEIA